MLFTQALISSRAISDWFAAEAGSIVSKLNGGLLGIKEPGEGGYRLNGFVRVPIQTGQCLALVENRKAEFDMFENPSIFLTFRENFYALDETVHEGLLFDI